MLKTMIIAAMALTMAFFAVSSVAQAQNETTQPQQQQTQTTPEGAPQTGF